MTCEEAGRKGGRISGDARRLKGREALATCKTFRELLAVVIVLEDRAWQRGYQAGNRNGYKRGCLDRVRGGM